MATVKIKAITKEFARMDRPARQALLYEKKEKLRQLRFDLAAGKIKDVREIREVRKDIARLSTILSLK